MWPIDTSTAISAQPTPGVAGVPGWFTGGNPISGVAATTLSADFCNAIQAEFLSIMAKAGVMSNKTLFAQLLQSLARLGGWNSTNVTGATSTTLTADNAGLITATITGNSTITLPPANVLNGGSGTGAPIVFHVYRLDTSGGTLTIAPAGSDQINGIAGSYTIAVGGRLSFLSNGSNGWLTSIAPGNNLHVLGTLQVDSTATFGSTIVAAGTITSSNGLIGTNSVGARTVIQSSAPTIGTSSGNIGDIWYEW